MRARHLQQGLHLLLGFDHCNHFGNHAVEAGVRAIRKAAQGVGDDLAMGQDAGESLEQRTHGFLSWIGPRRRLAGRAHPLTY